MDGSLGDGAFKRGPASAAAWARSLADPFLTMAMNRDLPPVIASFLEATNTREFAGFLSLFTADGHVNDEADDYHRAEIAAWIERAAAETKPVVEVVEVPRDGGQRVVTADVSGNFPGSPVQLRCFFGLEDDKIATLLIKA